MSGLTLSQIFIYPVKSLGGISVSSAVVTERGLQHDRRWMLIDEYGVAVTQREHHKLALVKVAVTSSGLELAAPHRPPLHVPFEPQGHTPVTVNVWQNYCKALVVSDEANAWFENFLGEPCRLVYMPDDSRRGVNPKFAIDVENVVSFADGYPFLIAGQASLDDLNRRLALPLPINRFRPNFVVGGSAAFAEDTWRKFSIGNIPFYGVKPCIRCVMTTVDQATGKSDGKEPLKTLATFRATENGVCFGENLIAGGTGTLRTGDPIEILELKQ
jgi:uncharacterized protein YcbX